MCGGGGCSFRDIQERNHLVASSVKVMKNLRCAESYRGLDGLSEEINQ